VLTGRNRGSPRQVERGENRRALRPHWLALQISYTDIPRAALDWSAPRHVALAHGSTPGSLSRQDAYGHVPGSPTQNALPAQTLPMGPSVSVVLGLSFLSHRRAQAAAQRIPTHKPARRGPPPHRRRGQTAHRAAGSNADVATPDVFCQNKLTLTPLKTNRDLSTSAD
jgi:hypothetical protein